MFQVKITLRLNLPDSGQNPVLPAKVQNIIGASTASVCGVHCKVLMQSEGGSFSECLWMLQFCSLKEHVGLEKYSQFTNKWNNLRNHHHWSWWCIRQNSAEVLLLYRQSRKIFNQSISEIDDVRVYHSDDVFH